MIQKKDNIKPSNITYSKNNILYNSQGIDTIRLIAKHEVILRLLERMGLEVHTAKKNTPLSQKLKDILSLQSKDKTTRYNSDEHKPTLQYTKLAKGKALNNYMTIARNTPLLFDYAKHHKKAKNTYCMIEFAGLHQPTSHIDKEVIKLISKILKYKAFKVHSIDIATDTTDKKPIDYKRKTKSKTSKELKEKGVILQGSSLYTNKPNKEDLGRVLFYDKYNKETKHHKKRLALSLKHWKRLEITIKPNIYERDTRKGFIDYINNEAFFSALTDIEEVAKEYKVKSYNNNYLIYQLNSFIDNRVMNNNESKKRFNSIESVERFKVSDFRRYVLL